MVDDRPEDTELPPDSGRAKRAPPTIDLEATEVSGETRNAGADATAGAPAPRRHPAAVCGGDFPCGHCARFPAPAPPRW